MIRRLLRAFTILELMVALALSSFLIGVVALATHHASRAGQETTRKIEARRVLGPPLERMQEDASRALALADLAGFFSANRIDTTLLDGSQVRTDAFELTLLDGDPPRLTRVRWSVGWDPVAEEGWLWRETTPVSAGELPAGLSWLASSAPPAREIVLSDVGSFALTIGDGPVELDPPAVGGSLPGLVIDGVGGPLTHDELGVPALLLEQVPPGTLVWLRDQVTSGAPGLTEGWYRLDRVEGDKAVLGERVGWAERVAFRTARLPRHLGVDTQASGLRARTVLPLAARREQQVFEEAARVAGVDPP